MEVITQEEYTIRIESAIAEAEVIIFNLFAYPDDNDWSTQWEEKALEWRLKNKDILYPLRETVLLYGFQEDQSSPLLFPENDLAAIKEEIEIWLNTIVMTGLRKVFSSEQIIYKNNPIFVKGDEVRKLYREILPNIYTEFFTKYKYGYENRIRHARNIGISTFTDYLMAFIECIKKDANLSTAESKREALKSLSYKNGELFKLMSYGTHTILTFEENHIRSGEFESKVISKDGSQHYIDHSQEGSLKHLFHNTPDNLREYLKRCPAAAIFIDLVTRIADALPDEYLMRVNQEA